MRHSYRQRQKEDLIKTFETALKDYGAISKREMEEYVAKETADKYDPRELEAILPRDLWSVVREYLAEDGDPMETVPEDLREVAEKIADKSPKSPREVAKITCDHSDNLRALKRQATLKHKAPTSSVVLSTIYDNPWVPGGTAPATGSLEPAHAGTIGKEASISDVTLARFYDTEPVAKSQNKPASPALRGLYDAMAEGRL